MMAMEDDLSKFGNCNSHTPSKDDVAAHATAEKNLEAA